MPKRGKGHKAWIKGRQSDNSTDYYEHDDRGGFSDTTRKVSFKGSNRISKKSNARLERQLNFRSIIDHEDIDMGVNLDGESSSRGHYKYQPYGRSRGGFNKRGGRHMGSNMGYDHAKLHDQTGWFRINIPHGSKHNKPILLGVLQSHIAPVELIPISYRVEGNNAVFFVDDMKVAEALQEADHKISIGGERHKLLIHVCPGMPRVDMTEALKERIKQAMVKRYNITTKALDLSRFHRDPELVDDTFCAVSRPPVFNAIVQVIAEHIPELQALNLDSNCLFLADHLSSLPRKVPDLKILYLGANRFRDLPQLSVLKSLPLVELKLEGNPLCKKYSAKEDYTRAVRKVFTKITRLDGVELPPVISFEVEDEPKKKLPPWQASFLCSLEGRDVARQFVEQYFTLYDAPEGASRQKLLEAYHECAVFSLTSIYPPGQGKPDGPKLNTYISESRNLLRISDQERRDKLLKTGRVSIVSFLCELPKTQHDPSSFALDLTICSQHLLSMTLTGVFREPVSKGTPPVRHFLRKFVLVPMGSGFCIINEMLFVTNASKSQIEKAFVTPTTPISSPAPVVATVASPPQISAEFQQRVVEELAAQTNMNFIWARKCLEETFWNPQQALHAFTELNANGRVPPEAFNK